MSDVPSSEITSSSSSMDQVDVSLPKEKHSVVISLDAVSSGKRRNNVRVRMAHPWQRPDWELSSDEPPAIGGEETGPMPLCFFATGIATCFMTQVRNFSKAQGVQVDGLSVEGRFEWQFDVGPSPREPYTGEAVQVRLDIDMDTQSPMEDQRSLIAAAARGCFAEAMLSIPVVHRLKSGDDWIVCDVD